MIDWPAPRRPAAHAEETLISAILDGTFAPGAALPAERELAVQLGITRPTLREALQRLARDGWITVRQGKPTRVNDIWREGGLSVLSAVVRFSRELPGDFVTNLLDVRLALAPAYTRAAVVRAAPEVAACLAGHDRLGDRAEDLAALDWRVHHTLTLLSGNPVYTLILNGFAGFYEQMARVYFAHAPARAVSRTFYGDLLAAAHAGDAEAAASITEAVMRKSIDLWRQARRGA